MSPSTPREPLILVPLDGSTDSAAALAPAAEVARRLGGRLLLVSAPQVVGVDVPPWFGAAPMQAGAVPVDLPDIDALIRQAEADSKAHLKAKADDAAALGVTADTQLLESPPAEAILRAAEAHDAYLVVMATHGRSGLSRWAIGSVAEHVIHRSRRPIVLVRSGATAPFALRHIAVLLDGSAAALEVFDVAEPLARAFEADVILVHVAGDPQLDGFDAARDGDVAAVTDQLAVEAVRLRAAGIDAATRVMDGGDVTAAMQALADEGVDLIALTTHGRTGVMRLALGSVADQVVRHAPLPVLLQRIRGANA